MVGFDAVNWKPEDDAELLKVVEVSANLKPELAGLLKVELLLAADELLNKPVTGLNGAGLDVDCLLKMSPDEDSGLGLPKIL